MAYSSDNCAVESSFPGGRRLSRLPEKSNFTQTCQLLSQFLKEKRIIGMNQRMEPNEGFPATMNLLTNLENSEENLKEKANGISSEIPALAPAPMTIFYGGKVLVFNDLPPETAEEIMAMAGKGICPSRSVATVPDKVIEPAAGNGNKLAGESKVSGDLPIARRASLHRFFEKRKDRVSARAPYQVNQQPHSVSSRAGETFKFNNGDEKGACESSNRFDLNL